MPGKAMVVALCAIGTAIAAASPASAQSIETRTVRVSYADLDLNSDVGARAMLRRLRAATADACEDPVRRLTLHERKKIRACRAEALGQAVAELDNERVSTMFARLEGDAIPVLYASR